MDNSNCDIPHVLPPAPTVPIIPSRENEVDIMAMLEAKVDPVQEERMRQKAMQFSLVGAIEQGNREKIKHLLQEGVNINASIMFTKTPLTHAIELRRSEVAALLLESNCKPELTVDHFPYSQPIHLAAMEGLSSVIEKLIEKKVDPNARDKDDMTPLHIGCYFGHVKTTQILIAHGADVNVKDSCGRTPLHRAVENGSRNVVTALLKHGVDTDVTDVKGWTALHLAIGLDYQDLFKMLIENKCKLDIKDVNNNTPLSIACNFLIRNNCDIIRGTQFKYDARKRDFIQGRYLSILQRPAEIREMLETVVALIDSGADVDGPEASPITIAAKAGHVDTVYMLLNSGALVTKDWDPLLFGIEQDIKMFQIKELIENHIKRQYSLLWQCKRTIRKVLAHTCSIENAILKLPLPPSIKTFLK